MLMHLARGAIMFIHTNEKRIFHVTDVESLAGILCTFILVHGVLLQYFGHFGSNVGKFDIFGTGKDIELNSPRLYQYERKTLI